MTASWPVASRWVEPARQSDEVGSPLREGARRGEGRPSAGVEPYLVHYTFLPFVTLTPPGLWFLQAMGMHIGRRCFINTECISDPRLITLSDDVALGGNVRIFAHYGGRGTW